jgi:putative DNA primase/helicase
LRPPPCVTAATEAYLEAEDAIAAWLDDCCTIRAGFSISKADARDSWSRWCQRTGQSGGRNEFTDKLEQHGLVSDKGTGGKRIFRGLAILREDLSDRYYNR